MSEFCKDCLEKQNRIEELEAALNKIIDYGADLSHAYKIACEALKGGNNAPM